MFNGMEFLLHLRELLKDQGDGFSIFAFQGMDLSDATIELVKAFGVVLHLCCSFANRISDIFKFGVGARCAFVKFCKGRINLGHLLQGFLHSSELSQNGGRFSLKERFTLRGEVSALFSMGEEMTLVKERSLLPLFKVGLINFIDLKSKKRIPPGCLRI